MDRAKARALRLGGSVLRWLWQRLSQVQHSSETGRKLVELLTRPIRYRDVRIVRGTMAGVRINLGGSFLRYLTGEAEPEVQQLLAELIEPGQTVYDVGANIGFFTILCSRLVGPEGRVYAFEPIPQNLAALRHNIELNGLRTSSSSSSALSSETGTAEMFVSPWSAFHSFNLDGATKRENHGADGGRNHGADGDARRVRQGARRARAGPDQDRCRGRRADRRRGHARDARSGRAAVARASSTTPSSATSSSSTRSITAPA